MQVTEGIHRVDGVRASNAYVVETDEGLVLVDTGIAPAARAILRFVRGLGYAPDDVRQVVITHCDIDHIGGAAALRAATGATVAIHADDAAVLAGRTPPTKGGRAMRAIVRLARFHPVYPDRLLADGDVVGGLRVVHVPGHTDGSIALVRDDGVVLSGDAMLASRRGVPRPPDPRLALDREQATASAGLIRATGARLLLPGHGAPARLEPDRAQ